MTTIEIWLLAIALAMDCFAVSVTSGLILKQVRLRPILTMALLFGLFQGLMPLIGWMGMRYLSGYIERFDHWIAFGLLAFIGGKMFWEGFKGSEGSHFDPTRLNVVLGLAVATSIDALAIGISFACTGMTAFSDILAPILIIGFVSFLFSLVGSLIGVRIGGRFHLPAEQIGGVILILIGIKILIEHLL